MGELSCNQPNPSMKTPVLCLVFFLSVFAHAQETGDPCDCDPNFTSTDTIPISRYLDAKDKGNGTTHGHLKSLYDLSNSISYITYPYVNTIDGWRIPPRQGEGATMPYHMLEANLDIRWPILIGSRQQNGRAQRARLTIDYNPNFRMFNDNSRPLSPTNQDVGLGTDVILFQNLSPKPGRRNAWLWKDNQPPEAYPKGAIYRKYFSAIMLSLKAHHYSNGQAPGFYYYDPVLDDSRNDYISGDFSTNYFKAMVYWSFSKRKARAENIAPSSHSPEQDPYPDVKYKDVYDLATVGFGYRHDGNALGIVYSEEQDRTFGYDRLHLVLDYRSRPFSFSKGGIIWKVQTPEGEKKYGIRKLHILRTRLELEHILGDLSHFRPNLNAKTGTYRTGAKLGFELLPMKNEKMGYVLQFYYGRDYLNVRYDSIIYSIQAGISFTFDKYTPIGWSNGRSVCAQY